MKKITLLLTGLLWVACTSNTIQKKPADLIPKDTMVSLLTDLFIATYATSEKNINLEKKVNYMPLVYQRYKIDSVRFKRSNFYYLTKVDEYNDMYRQVKRNLDTQKEALDSILKWKRDSLKKATYKNFQKVTN